MSDAKVFLPSATSVRSGSFFPREQQQPSSMKRQRVETVSSKEMALNVLLTQTKATIVIGMEEGKAAIRLCNAAAKELLAEFVDKEGNSSEATSRFWNSINRIIGGDDIKEEEFVLPGSRLLIKYRRIENHSDPIIVVTAKNIVEKKKTPSSLFLQHGPADEVVALTNAVEEDIIGRTLGLGHLILTLTLRKPEDVDHHTYLSGNVNAARRLKASQAYQMRGRTSVEMNQPAADVNSLHQLFRTNFNVNSKTSSFNVVPGVNLGLSLMYKQMPQKGGPRKLPTAKVKVPKKWIRSRWDSLVEDCIRHIQHNQHHASKSHNTIPTKFLEDAEYVYSYALINYEGLKPIVDGYAWKSSRSTVCTGDGATSPWHRLTFPGSLQKRYHYTDLPDGKKLRRRMMWLNEIKGVYIVEYRHTEASSSGTEMAKLLGPECMDWQNLIEEVHSQMNQQFTASCDLINSHFDMAETRTDQNQLEPDEVTSYVNNILHKWASDFGQTQTSCLHLGLDLQSALAVQLIRIHLESFHRSWGSLRTLDRQLCKLGGTKTFVSVPNFRVSLLVVVSKCMGSTQKFGDAVSGHSLLTSPFIDHRSNTPQQSSSAMKITFLLIALCCVAYAYNLSDDFPLPPYQLELVHHTSNNATYTCPDNCGNPDNNNCVWNDDIQDTCSVQYPAKRSVQEKRQTCPCNYKIELRLGSIALFNYNKLSSAYTTFGDAVSGHSLLTSPFIDHRSNTPQRSPSAMKITLLLIALCCVAYAYNLSDDFPLPPYQLELVHHTSNNATYTCPDNCGNPDNNNCVWNEDIQDTCSVQYPAKRSIQEKRQTCPCNYKYVCTTNASTGQTVCGCTKSTGSNCA
ncbi:hypothetical protein PROFUN_05442 [Planoprotostelium fungivorum]|uniref:Uncharacterized protein n=1 Tax=Planoprotostelium fungivorum TaxID=1890364 RepID=A0A2P6NQR8_9EUKA|nr:hypothetical protein PROFUN_05442 [Planoprotostelium fungivorum]